MHFLPVAGIKDVFVKSNGVRAEIKSASHLFSTQKEGNTSATFRHINLQYIIVSASSRIFYKISKFMGSVIFVLEV